ncbi:MAG: protein kinase [Deltaproteobacteria bacterium]|nr:protein kinase [Deltaproteobacteria bacterium]
MGVVLLAARADVLLKQPVALKLPRTSGLVHTLAARLDQERDILGTLAHPHIARLLDAGVTDAGQPFLALEYVEGEPIDTFAIKRSLGVRERLDLFMQIAAAVAHAHERLVVHRDLKPSNILVTSAGQVQLLDFGIARLLEGDGLISAESEATQQGGRASTPSYASPEQLAGGPIGVASDVYSMGVVLYELLSGERPYKFTREQQQEGLRAALEKITVARPSERCAEPARARALVGDLDTIVLKALKLEPAARYPTVHAFAEDVQRHLEGRPVQARPDSAMYRVTRFVQRNRLAVAAAAAVALSLVAGIVATTWEARVAREQKTLAERRSQDLQRMANQLIFELHDAIAQLPGSTPARKLLVERALTFLDGLAATAPDDPQLLQSLAEGYQRLGDVQGNGTAQQHLGDLKGARASLEKALAAADRLRALRPADPWIPEHRPEILRVLSDVLFSIGDLDASLSAAREARQSLLDLPVASTPAMQLKIGRLESDIGDVLGMQKKPDEALASYTHALERLRALTSSGTADPVARRVLSVILLKVADAGLAKGDITGATAQQREALALREKLAADQPQSASARRDLQSARVRIANGYVKRKDLKGALEIYESVLAADRAAQAADPQNVQAWRDVTVDLIKIADTNTAIASDIAAPAHDAETARRCLRAAREKYVEAGQSYAAQAEKGALLAQDKDMPAQVVQAIATVDAELAKLDAPASPKR